MGQYRTVPPATLEDVRTKIAHPATIVYLTFGTEDGAAWGNAVWALADYAMIELFLLEDPAVLEQIPWPADRRTTDGTPLGDAIPKGVFISRDGSVALVLTGRQAEQPNSLYKAYKAVKTLGGGA